MRKGPLLLVGSFLFCGSLMALAQTNKQPDGSVVEQSPCPVVPKRTYEAYAHAMNKVLSGEVAEAAREGFKLDFVGQLLSPEEYARRISFTAYDCQRIVYMSDGLRVVGFVWRPKNTHGKKVPLVIANRGGNRDFGKLNPTSFFYPFVTNGFAVIASQYRGVDGGEGVEEFGGADVNDVMNLIPVARSLGYVDMNNVFMYGESRGGMMAFLALKHGVPVNSVATVGALADMIAAGKDRPRWVEAVWKNLIPGYATRDEEALRGRSAVYWPEQINVPVLILQGGADWRNDAGHQALALAGKLQSLGKTYQLIIYAGDDHSITVNRLDRERRTVEWFKRHMK